MNRLLRLLLGAVAGLLIVVIFLAYRMVPHSQTPFAKAEKDAGRLVLAMAGQRAELNKEAGIWKVAMSSGPSVADAAKVTSFLATLGGVKLEEVISELPSQAALFEVTEASGTRVTLWDGKGQTLADGIFGKQAPDLTHLYFRFADRPRVYLASGLFRGELSPGKPSDWLKVETSTAAVKRS